MLLEAGHTRDTVLEYELPYLYGYTQKKFDMREEEKDYKTGAHTKDGWQQKGNKRTKTITSDQMLAKLRAKGQNGSR